MKGPEVQAFDLSVHFPLRGVMRAKGKRVCRALEGVNLVILSGSTVGLVGESGSGKTTLGRALVGLVRPTAGRVVFDGTDLSTLDKARLRALRRRMQIIFQDPNAALDPRLPVSKAVGEALAVHRLARGAERDRRVGQLLEQVGLASSDGSRLPHELSTGQKQRIAIARAIASDPSFLVADEPVAALDVSVQAQIVNLLLELKPRRNLTYLFISHDLRVVESVSDEVFVMYGGRVMETGPAERVLRSPRHPYTRALVQSRPGARQDGDVRARPLPGERPSGIEPPLGCPFHPRCPEATERCRTERPLLRELLDGSAAACHLL